jgi:hypothetical protein
MTGAPSRSLSVQLRSRRNLVPNRDCKERPGNLLMNNSTTRYDKPSRPATRFRSFKMFAVADCAKIYACNFSSAHVGHPKILISAARFHPSELKKEDRRVAARLPSRFGVKGYLRIEINDALAIAEQVSVWSTRAERACLPDFEQQVYAKTGSELIYRLLRQRILSPQSSAVRQNPAWLSSPPKP